jgi:pyruvate-formate lyase-activating enzyme
MSSPAPPASLPPDPRASKRANWHAYEASAAAGELAVAHKPVQLYLEITSRCNLRCAKCGFAWDPSLAKNGRDIAWPLLAGMEDFFAAATEVYTFGYGEMFLYPELAPLITVLKNHNCRVSGVTNGVLIRPADVVWLVATGYDHLAFSIDGATEETMQELRGASHRKILAVLRLIHEEKQRRQAERPNIVVNFVAQADNYKELPELARQLAPLKIHFLGVNPLHHFDGTTGGYYEYYEKFKLGRVPREEFDAAIAEARTIAEGAGMIFESFVNPAFEWPAAEIAPTTVPLHVHDVPAAAPPPEISAEPAPEAPAAAPPAVSESLPVIEAPVSSPPAPILPSAPPGLSPMYCHYPWTTMYLSASGTAKVCCYMAVNEGLGRFTGEGGLDAVWNGPDLQSVREHIRDGRVHPACRQCVVHRSFENHPAAMNPIRAELFPPLPPEPEVVPPPPPPVAEPTGLQRFLRKFRTLRSGSGASGAPLS